MKSKWLGLLILLLVAFGALYYFGGNQTGQPGPSREPDTTLRGYLGGEKIGLFEDDEVQALLAKKYGLHLDYNKAGSLAMVDADHAGMNYLFPSSQTALDLYQRKVGTPKQSEIIFNTPIVIYTHTLVRDALLDQGLITQEGEVYYMDMPKLVEAIHDGVSWSELGLPQLYGSVSVQTTDPTASNSGNMFSGLVANVLNEGQVVTMDTVDEILPALQTVFQRLGYMEKSSADLFDQFLKTGVGAKPMIAGYESQLLEFAVTYPQDWEKLRNDIVIVYPVPTVWSSHVYIALDEDGQRGIEALMDEDVQGMAWEKHGYRTSFYGAGSSIDQFNVNGVAQDVTQVAPMPDSNAMERIIDTLS